MVALGTTYPLAGLGGFTDEQWSDVVRSYGDGIVNDIATSGASPFNVTAKSSSDRNVTLATGEYRIRGRGVTPTAPTVVVTLPAVSAGQTRADRIVLRYDDTTKAITVEVRTGTGVTSGTPVPPTLTRVDHGVWEDLLWTIVGGSGSASTLTYTDERPWIGALGRAYTESQLDDSWPVGSKISVRSTGDEWRRVRASSGAQPTWENLSLPERTALTLNGSALVAYGPPPAYSKLGRWVTLHGALQSVSGANILPPNGTTVVLGTLPSGYRPALYGRFITIGNGFLPVSVRVMSAGTIEASTNQTGISWIALDGIGFYADGG